MNKLFMLSQINLLDELPMEEIEAIDKMTDVKPIKKGTIIFGPEHPWEALFLLKKGRVRLYRLSSAGKQFTVDILGDGNVFGETASFSFTGDDVYAEALEETYLCVLSKSRFEALVKAQPELSLKFISILSSRLKELSELSENIAVRDVKSRIIYLLLRLSERFGTRQKEWQTIEMKLTHHDIASMIGSTRETVSLCINELKKETMIEKDQYWRINVKKAMEIVS